MKVQSKLQINNLKTKTKKLKRKVNKKLLINNNKRAQFK